MSVDDRDGRFGREAALAFPGVGVALSGRERSFFVRHRAHFAPLFEAASGYCGVDLAARLLADRVDELPEEARQLFTYAFSAGAADAVLATVCPRAAAGYSFGVYAALYAAGVFSFEDGLFVVERAHRVMQEAAAAGGLGMGAVVGLELAELSEIVEEAALTSVVRVNTNHPLCHIFSGRLDEIDDFLERAGRAGAFKFQRLEVTIPYHHPEILAAAPEGLGACLGQVTWSRARFPVVSTLDGGCLVDPDAIVDFLARHLACPISWQLACEVLRDLGVGAVYECGPGVSLTQNARFLPFEMAYTNVKKDLRCPAP